MRSVRRHSKIRPRQPGHDQWLIGYGVPFDSTLCPYKTSFPEQPLLPLSLRQRNSGAFRRHPAEVRRGHRVKGRGTSGKQLYKPLSEAALSRVSNSTTRPSPA